MAVIRAQNRQKSQLATYCHLCSMLDVRYAPKADDSVVHNLGADNPDRACGM